MVALRDIMLRKPLGLHFTQEYLRQEVDDLLIGCFEKSDAGSEELIGCCILSPVDEELVQLRQMAVAPGWQGSGIGRSIMEFAEEEARRHGFRTLMMHARKTAVPFYERVGYRISGEEFLEVSIPHFEMRKELGE
jgi:predicted GNAT family N-acyltransferase